MLNTITIAGRLVRDPELRRTASGKAVTSFTLACDRDFKSQQTGEKEVDFLDCTAFGAAGENAAKYFHKGQMAMVTGRLQIQRYIDKSGQKRSRAEIVATSVYFCGSKESGYASSSVSGSGYSTPAYQVNAPSGDFAELEDDDAQLPF